MPGPAPTKNPRRGQRGRPDWRKLPAKGRKGRTPKWPLPGEPGDGVRALWADLWRTPQAVAWEDFGWTRVVARYALTVYAAETGATAAVMAEARQLEDRLGLNPMAMRRLLWEIVDESADVQETPAGVTSLDARRAALA